MATPCAHEGNQERQRSEKVNEAGPWSGRAAARGRCAAAIQRPGDTCIADEVQAGRTKKTDRLGRGRIYEFRDKEQSDASVRRSKRWLRRIYKGGTNVTLLAAITKRMKRFERTTQCGLYTCE